MKTLLRSLLPELLMIAIMAVLALAFMSPVFEGKILYQNDIVQAKNMANELVQFQKQTGEYSAWTNSAFGGMPAYQIKSGPTGNIFHWLFRMLKLYLPGYTVAILFICNSNSTGNTSKHLLRVFNKLALLVLAQISTLKNFDGIF